MKAILVIDFPKDGCKSCFLDVYGHCLANENMDSRVCPLRPMPERNEEVYEDLLDAQWKDGYNTCLDRIMGGNE